MAPQNLLQARATLTRMFNPSQADVRRFFCAVHAKTQSGAPMEAIETLASLWIAEHPEYHADLSDVDAALHYLARMLEAGEDPRFIARRIVIAASEDVGMADPSALQTAVAAMHAVAQIGMPEARIILAQAVVHNAMAPKSNAAYVGINEAIADIRSGKGGSVPAHLRGSGYAGAARLGHGEGYVYAHNEPDAVAAQTYLPEDLVGRTDYYRPTDRGFEARLQERWQWLRERLRDPG